MSQIRHIDADAVHPAVHGKGLIFVSCPEGIALALVAYGRSTGVLGGILETWSGASDAAGTFDPAPMRSLLGRADWALAHGARDLKPIAVALLPEAERKAWICSTGILERHINLISGEHLDLPELLKRAGMIPKAKFPAPLDQVLGLVHLLGQGDPPRLGEALRRAGVLQKTI